MAYQHIENILTRKGEKVALLLTAENAVGLAFVAGPLYFISDGWSLWLRVPAVILACVLGILMTQEIGGQTFYERVLWRARGLIKRLMRGRTLRPVQISGTRLVANPARPLRAGGPIQVVRRATLAGLRRPPAEAVASDATHPSLSVTAPGQVHELGATAGKEA